LRVVSRYSVAIVPLLLAGPTPAFAAEGLNLFPRPDVLLLNLVVFAALIYPIDRLLVRPLVRVLAERESRTAGALERTDEVVTEANRIREQLESKLREARARAAEQRAAVLARGEEEERGILDRAREEAGRSLDQVRQGVGAELEAARQALTADASELAREAAARILGRSL
jgi:F-type H+-transporting ATPase subunit b